MSSEMGIKKADQIRRLVDYFLLLITLVLGIISLALVSAGDVASSETQGELGVGVESDVEPILQSQEEQADQPQFGLPYAPWEMVVAVGVIVAILWIAAKLIDKAKRKFK